MIDAFEFLDVVFIAIIPCVLTSHLFLRRSTLSSHSDRPKNVSERCPKANKPERRYLSIEEPLQSFTTVKVQLRKVTTPAELHEKLGLKYAGTYDFLKLPFDRETRQFKQTAFINFCSKAEAQQFRKTCKLQTSWAGFQGIYECVSSLGESVAKIPLHRQPIVLVDGKRANLGEVMQKMSGAHKFSYPSLATSM